jgi:hypothetical protein
LIAVDADAPAEAHGTAAELRGDFVERHAAGVEAHDARDVLQRVRQIEVTNAAVLDSHRAVHHRGAQRTIERCCERRLTRAADVGNEPLQDAEVRRAVGAHRNPLVVQVDHAGDVELRLLANQPHVGDANRMAVEGHPNRDGVAQAVVEEPQIELVNGRIDNEVIDVGKFAHNAEIAAGNGGRIRRQLRIERAEIRVE